ncbi:hypothetical protein [Parenemella sanctibonifatiensis]|uniref:Uncharacterized protein n=1 Tax=Parenemella sanctibonifatiensis TaxID=2016505 RepID=A0A255EKE5_9ACTN|nr:hypothetical protein [Parenemella sanctibonifatiensis]OYN92019.1 hypothetical protein CGZ91_00355 [Parenemella sanctibonifatiensis]
MPATGEYAKGGSRTARIVVVQDGQPRGGQIRNAPAEEDQQHPAVLQASGDHLNGSPPPTIGIDPAHDDHGAHLRVVGQRLQGGDLPVQIGVGDGDRAGPTGMGARVLNPGNDGGDDQMSQSGRDDRNVRFGLAALPVAPMIQLLDGGQHPIASLRGHRVVAAERPRGGGQET